MTSARDLFASRVPAPERAGLYQTIVSDPPWYEAGGGQIKRGADRHYPLMKTADICALPVREWAAPNAHLYLWVTNNFLRDGFAVMDAWGFRFVTKITWTKAKAGRLEVPEASELQVGLGQYFRGCSEDCLFGVRGMVPYRTRPDGKRAQGKTWFSAPRQEHSQKPEIFRQTVEMVSTGPYLEMFARRAVAGWDAWGNQAPIAAEAV